MQHIFYKNLHPIRAFIRVRDFRMLMACIVSYFIEKNVFNKLPLHHVGLQAYYLVHKLTHAMSKPPIYIFWSRFKFRLPK